MASPRNVSFVDACRTNPANTVLLTQQSKFQTGFAGTTFTTPTGYESEFQMDDARVFATTGNLSLQFGDKGKMEIKNSGGWYQPRLAARRGTLTLTTGAMFTGSVVQSGLQGAAGIGFSFNGFDSGLKIEGSDMLLSSGATSPGPYVAGPFQVSSSATKVAFEAIGVNLMEASRSVQIALAGPESRVGLKDFRSQTSSQLVSIAATGTKSEVKVENILVYGIPDVLIESGVQGSTGVTNNPGSITATQLIRIRAGLGGSCSASSQGLSAPQVQVCR